MSGIENESKSVNLTNLTNLTILNNLNNLKNLINLTNLNNLTILTNLTILINLTILVLEEKKIIESVIPKVEVGTGESEGYTLPVSLVTLRF